MRIAVIGGTGLIGRKLVGRLGELGHEAIVAARATGVDTLTGEGLDRALDQAEVVVDVSSSGYSCAGEMRSFFEASGATLAAAERRSGTAHHVTLSAVGVGRIDSGYFRAKAAQEGIAAGTGLPFTILRSTPFFEFIYGIVDAGGSRDGGDIRLPPVQMQPVAADDVARALASVALRPPVCSAFEFGGPETYRLPDLAEAILTANEDPRRVVVDPEAPYFGAIVGDAPLTVCHNPRFAPGRFEDWLRRSLDPGFAGPGDRIRGHAPAAAGYEVLDA